MTRIDDAAKIIAREVEGMENTRVRHVYAARALDADGHLTPALPEADKSIDGSRHWGHTASWYPEHGLCRWDDGMGNSTTVAELRKEAAELLAAAGYAEEQASE